MRGPQYIILSCLFFLQCAQPSVPSGGEKDNTPPVITESSILNGSTNQPENLRKLVLEFDENIQLGTTSEIMFSPRLTTKPEIIAKAKKVIIKFNEPLEENTTYLINFGKVIKDYTEGNVLDSNLFAFSTGNEIDSLSISGTVVDGFTRKPIENALVMLFKTKTDSALYSGEPQYYNSANSDGQLKLPFLKAGTYQIFGLSDQNNNLKYDLPDEKVYFSNSNLTVEKDSSFEIALSPIIEPENYVSEYTWFSKYHLSLTFDQDLTVPLEFTSKNQQDYLLKRYSSNPDSTDIYFFAPVEYNEVMMNWGNNQDTLKVESDIDSLDMPLSDSLSITTDFTEGKSIPYFEPLVLTSNHRIKYINPGRAYFTHDGDTFPLVIKPADSSGLSFFIDFDWNQSTEYTFFLPEGLLETYHGTKSDESIIEVITDSEENYSTLFLDLVDWTNQSCIVQLESGEEVIDKLYVKSGESPQLVFEHLPPKKYDFRLIYDTNQNGQWDIGNYTEGRLPERVRIMSEGVETKRGFDFEVKWYLAD